MTDLRFRRRPQTRVLVAPAEDLTDLLRLAASVALGVAVVLTLAR